MTVTNRHYDAPPEVFEVFLDRRMKYTSGLYGDGVRSLDDAQEAKLDLIASRLELRGGEQVLDIGCGWGSLTVYLAEKLRCLVTAVTPAPSQARYVRRRADAAGVGDLVLVHAGRFEDADLAGPRFDAIAMVGVIEHLSDRVTALDKVSRLLRPDGRLYLSASCYRTNAARNEYEARPASLHAVEVYGYTVMPSLSGLVAELEDAGLCVTSLTDLTRHYHRTLDDWQARIAAERVRMDELVPGFAGDLCRYFQAMNASWGYTASHYALTAGRGRMREPKPLP